MEELKQKITSEDQLLALVGSDLVYNARLKVASRAKAKEVTHVAWWAAREELRMMYGNYEVTEACTAVNQLGQGFVHISEGDRSMVAFTPDKAAGEADRQIVTTFGRVASKYLPVFSENYIRKLTEDHLADLSDEFELLPGSEIAAVYAATDTVSSCMVGKKWTGLPVAPPSLYDIPGVWLAVLRGADNAVTARSIVRHTEDGRKLYIRADYGDPRLKRRLIKKGYEPGGWEGAVFKRVIVENYGEARVGGVFTEKHKFVMPYLDSYGSVATKKGSCILNTEEGIRVIDSEEQASLIGAGFADFMTTASSSYGYNELPVFKRSFVEYFDELLGHTVLATDVGKAQPYLRADTTIGTTSNSGLVDRGYTIHRLRDGSRIWCPEGTPFFVADSWRNEIDIPENRINSGYALLHPTFYGVGGCYADKVERNIRGEAWGKKHKTATVTLESGEEVCVLQEHAYRQLTGETLTWHWGTPPKHLKKTWPNMKGVSTYFDPKTEKLERTVSGKYVHELTNDNIVRIYDGRFEFSRNAKSASPFGDLGEDIWVQRRMSDADEKDYERYVSIRKAEIVEAALAEHGIIDGTIALVNLVGRAYYRSRLTYYDAMTSETRFRELNLHEISRLMDNHVVGTGLVKEWLEAQLDYCRRYHSDPFFLSIGQQIAYRFAEMEAIDYNIIAAEAQQEEHHDAADSVAAPVVNVAEVRLATEEAFEQGTAQWREVASGDLAGDTPAESTAETQAETSTEGSQHGYI